ncbi:hypothetical protein QOT17_010452 [Balamuthia mandrillaris]
MSCHTNDPDCEDPDVFCMSEGCGAYSNPVCQGYCISCSETELPRLRKEAKALQRAQRTPIQQSLGGWSLELPPEVWFGMLTHHADVFTVGRLLLVCRDLYHLCSSDRMWKALWQREAPKEWEQLLVDSHGKEDQTGKKKDLMERFVKAKVFCCVHCGKGEVLEVAEKKWDRLRCTFCRKDVCSSSDCTPYCEYCGEPFCKRCVPYCVVCDAAMHCHADEWNECSRCEGNICLSCSINRGVKSQLRFVNNVSPTVFAFPKDKHGRVVEAYWAALSLLQFRELRCSTLLPTFSFFHIFRLEGVLGNCSEEGQHVTDLLVPAKWQFDTSAANLVRFSLPGLGDAASLFVGTFEYVPEAKDVTSRNKAGTERRMRVEGDSLKISFDVYNYTSQTIADLNEDLNEDSQLGDSFFQMRFKC